MQQEKHEMVPKHNLTSEEIAELFDDVERVGQDLGALRWVLDGVLSKEDGPAPADREVLVRARDCARAGLERATDMLHDLRQDP